MPVEVTNAILDAVEQAASGHVGLPLGMADVATILWTHYLKHDPADPAWPDRDRFVLSAGHGSMLVYSLLHLTGYDSVSREDIRNFRVPFDRLMAMLDSGELVNAPMILSAQYLARHRDRLRAQSA